MAAFASLLAASAALRVASLNLCSDEYLLLLAHPGEVVSVSRLSQDPQDSILAPLARRVSGNRGRIEDVIAARSNLVLTMGGGGRSSGAIARSLGIRVIDLPAPATIDEVAENLRIVAAALGDPRRAAPAMARIAALRAASPQGGIDTIWLGHGGLTQSPGSLGARWMALAGMAQRPLTGGRATLEALITSPPKILVTSNYRAGQVSQGQRWLAHPLLAALPSRLIATDGRAWTCGGPMMIGEIERLRAAR
jgi:iron complex transport system substrate-binding protein